MPGGEAAVTADFGTTPEQIRQHVPSFIQAARLLSLYIGFEGLKANRMLCRSFGRASLAPTCCKHHRSSDAEIGGSGYSPRWSEVWRGLDTLLTPIPIVSEVRAWGLQFRIGLCGGYLGLSIYRLSGFGAWGVFTLRPHAQMTRQLVRRAV